MPIISSALGTLLVLLVPPETAPEWTNTLLQSYHDGWRHELEEAPNICCNGLIALLRPRNGFLTLVQRRICMFDWGKYARGMVKAFVYERGELPRILSGRSALTVCNIPYYRTYDYDLHLGARNNV